MTFFGQSTHPDTPSDPLTARQLATLVRDVQFLMEKESLDLDAACRVLFARVSPATLEQYAYVLVAQENGRLFLNERIAAKICGLTDSEARAAAQRRVDQEPA